MEILALYMRAAKTAVEQFSILKKALIKDRKYNEDLLYRGFDGNDIPRLLKTGQDTDNEYLFCAREIDIIDTCIISANVFMYASQKPLPTIAVFDSDHLEKCIDYEYIFKNPDRKFDALVTVYLLR